MNVNPKYIETIPDKAIFKKSSDLNKYYSTVMLNNLTDNFIIFQIFLNKQTSYSVIPSVGYIEPEGSNTICIKHIEDELDVRIKINIRKISKTLIRRINFS